MQTLKKCQVIGHHETLISHLCLYKECFNDFRWACNICLEKNVHNHKEQNNHMMNQQQLIGLLQLEPNYFNELIPQINLDFFTLSRPQINIIIDFHYQRNIDNKQKIPQKRDQKQQLLKKQTKNQLQEQMNYDVYFQEEICEKNCFYFHSPYICPKEKYLIISVGTTFLIYDLMTKQQIQQKRMPHRIDICLFSKDSKYFFCGSFLGWLLCFKVNSNFKLIYRQQPFPFFRDQMIIIEPCLIVLLSQKQLKIINIKINKQQQIINTDCHKIWVFEYNDKIKHLIYVMEIQPSKHFIKFIKIPTLQIIFSQEFQLTQKIQLLGDDQLITFGSSFDQNLYFWQINYAEKQVTLLRVFNNRSRIQNFNYFKTVDRIFIYSGNNIQIISTDLKKVQNIKHKVNCDCIYFSIFITDLYNCKNKPKSLNYIVITEKKFLTIMKLDQGQ